MTFRLRPPDPQRLAMCKLLRGGPDDRHIFTMVAAELQSVINAQIQEDKSCFGACAWELVSDGVRSQLHGLPRLCADRR